MPPILGRRSNVVPDTVHLQDSEDIRFMTAALKQLGVRLEEDWANDQITVHGCAGKFPVADASLFLGNAGTAMRWASHCTCNPIPGATAQV